MKNKLNLNYLLFAVIASLLFGLLHNYLSKKPLGLIRHKGEIVLAKDEDLIEAVEGLKETRPEENFSKEKSFKEAGKNKVVNTVQAFRMFKNKSAIFIDARDEWDFGAGHIKGAINIPEYNFESIYEKYSGNNNSNEEHFALNKNKPLIVYCSSKDCNLAERVANNLKEKGFKKVYIYLEGWEAWMAKNHPIEATKED